MATTYYVYVDWTTEDQPRPYYVGQGTGDRIQNPHRNSKHDSVRTRFGLDRRVVFSTMDEQKALDKEHELMTVLRTTEGDLGCNIQDCRSGGKMVTKSYGRKAVHLKLDSDVHTGFKRYAAKKRTTMQALLEDYAAKLAQTEKGQ